VGDKKRWGVIRKTNLTQSRLRQGYVGQGRKGAKEKRKKALRHYRFDPTLGEQIAVLAICPSAGRPLVCLPSSLVKRSAD
jgi:hypothetical protein